MHGIRSAKVSLWIWCAAISLIFASAAVASNPKPQISMEAAKKIALAKEAGQVKSQELEKEKGRWIYSFDIARDKQIHEVNVDANTGEVLEDSVENPADEAKEKMEEQKPQR
jgi:hypothetical protein